MSNLPKNTNPIKYQCMRVSLLSFTEKAESVDTVDSSVLARIARRHVLFDIMQLSSTSGVKLAKQKETRRGTSKRSALVEANIFLENIMPILYLSYDRFLSILIGCSIEIS